MKLKYERENGVRVHYTEDKNYKIVPDPSGFSWYRKEEGNYKRFGYSSTLYEAKEYLSRIYNR